LTMKMTYALCVRELRPNALSSLICWYWFSQMYIWHILLSHERGNILL